MVVPCREDLGIWGVLFSIRLKWNTHFDFVLKKMSKCFLPNLQSCEAIVSIEYSSSNILFSFLISAFCNTSEYLLKKFVRVEKISAH